MKEIRIIKVDLKPREECQADYRYEVYSDGEFLDDMICYDYTDKEWLDKLGKLISEDLIVG